MYLEKGKGRGKSYNCLLISPIKKLHAHMYTHIHTHIYSQRHTHIHADTHIYVHIHTDVHTQKHIYTHRDVHTHRETHIHIQTCTHTHSREQMRKTPYFMPPCALTHVYIPHTHDQNSAMSHLPNSLISKVVLLEII